MNIQEAYKTLGLAKGLGMDRVEAQFTKLKTEMETKIASTSNGRLKQVYTNRLDEIEEAYAALLEHFEGGVQGVTEDQPIVHSPSTAHQTKAANSKWLLPAAIIFAGVLVSFTLIYFRSSTEAPSSVNASKEEGASTQVTIGTQVWMTENLNVDKFRNGDPIPEAKTEWEWDLAGDNGEPAWCYYDNDPTNGAKYGKLYNWYAVNDSRGLAPIGWHVPSDKEWTVLTDYLGGEDVAGTKIKSKSGWDGTNASGFSALPGGYRFRNGAFGRGTFGFWWSSSEASTTNAQRRSLGSSQAGVSRHSYYKAYGFSVRCLKD